MSFIASRFGAATGRDLIEVHLTGAEVCPTYDVTVIV